MALKFNLKNITNDDLDKAKSDLGGRYDGPTPPPGKYNVKVAQLWAGESKKGESTLVARLQFSDEGENKTYNGFSIFHRMAIPDDPSDQFFAIRMKSLDDFFRAASGGKLNINGFVEAANAGKIVVEKEEKVGEPIKQIGKFKLDNAQDITVMTKQNGEYTNVHYIDTRNVGQAQVEAESSDDVDGLDDDDIDGLLGGLDD